MAKKVGPDDLFDDGSMSFGDHIEELRTHLIRALLGILVAVCVTLAFAHKVVEVLTWPIKEKLEIWHKRRLDANTVNYIKTQEGLDPENRTKVPLHLTLAPKEQQKFFPNRPADEPLTMAVQIDAYELVHGLSLPMAEVTQPWDVKTFSAQEPFVMYFTASLGSAVILASPWVFYQIYAFIAVGLYAHERRLVRMALPVVVGLFVSGVLFCYFVMLPLMLGFLISANDWMGLQPDIRLNEWVSFCVILMLIFGVSFQLPVLIVVLERVGLVSYETFAGKRRLAIFIIFIIAAVVTPTPDPLSQSALAIPLYVLYEAGLFMMRRNRRPAALQSEEGPAVAFDDLLAGQFK